MSYTLISSDRSPFGRVCRIFMINHKMAFTFRALNFVDNAEDAKVLAQESPINKVPILVLDDSRRIFDSRVIINFLMKQHAIEGLSLEEENIVSAIYSCLDVSVILFLMRHSGYDIEAKNPYLDRQKARLPSNLEFIKPWAQRLNPNRARDWNYASMALYSFLFWAEARAKTIRMGDHPALQDFMIQFAQAPGIKESGF